MNEEEIKIKVVLPFFNLGFLETDLIFEESFLNKSWTKYFYY